MGTTWKITYHNICCNFPDAESAFRFFMTIYKRRDAKTATIEKLNPEGYWETIKF